MGFNFPSSPTVGQLYPSPAVPGSPVWKWNGSSWVGALSGQGGTTVYISDSPPTGVAIGTLWWESDTGILYIYYDDGTSAQWVTVAGTSAAVGSVRYDVAQTLDTTQRTTARQNIHAAPFDALAYNGIQVNGNMEVSQEVGTAGITIPTGTNGGYLCDGWQVVKTGTSVLSAYDYNSAQSETPGYRSALQLEATTPQASIGSDYVRFRTKIEGRRISRLAFGTANAQPLTVGFWFRASLVGNYRAIIYNQAADYFSSWQTFAVSGFPIWRWITVTFPPSTTGTWVTDNNPALILEIEVASSGVPNIVSATSQYASITGVVMLPGLEAPSAARAPFIMRPYDQELITCQRYLQAPLSGGQYGFPGFCGSPTTARISVPFRTIMRATPVLVVQNAALININTPSVNVAGTSVVLSNGGIGAAALDVTTSGLTTGHACTAGLPSGSVLFDARL